MQKTLHRILYRLLPLGGYLRVVSSLFFVWHRLGIGRRSEALEYVYHLDRLVRRNDTAIDIGANLGYYSRTLSRIVGPGGRVLAVEPMPPVLEVLRRNLRRCRNVEIFPCALGEAPGEITMANTTVAATGYFGTGQNFIREETAAKGSSPKELSGEEAPAKAIEYRAPMRRGSELFGSLARIDFIKCDVEGYEWHIMQEIRPLLERHRPTVLIETGGPNRPRIIDLFTALGYRGYTLNGGRETPLTAESHKDIIFRPL